MTKLRHACILGLLAAIAVYAGGSAYGQSAPDKAAAVEALLGGSPDAADAAYSALAAWPGGPAGVLAVAALTDAGDDDDPTGLGTLRVGLVMRRGGGFVVAAANDESGDSAPARTVVPSSPDVGIDPAAFTIAPGEVALGVDVSESLTTESIWAGSTSLLLYRRIGARLMPIFSARVDEFVIDKSAHPEPPEQARHIVRFTSHRTRGYFDLILSRPGARIGTLYRWTGDRYQADRR